MKRRIFTLSPWVVVALILAAFAVSVLRSDTASTISDGKLAESNPAGPADQPIKDAYGKLPMSFERNVGQTDEAVRFMARGQGYSLFLTQRDAVLSLQRYDKSGKVATRSAVRMSVVGASDTASIEGEAPTEARSKYFIGNDPDKWQTDVPHFQKVRYSSI